MTRTRNLAAYIVWATALAAILTPPAVATAAMETVSTIGTSVYSIVVDDDGTDLVAAMAKEALPRG